MSELNVSVMRGTTPVKGNGGVVFFTLLSPISGAFATITRDPSARKSAAYAHRAKSKLPIYL